MVKPELTTIINRLFDDEDFVRLLFDEREKKDRLEFCMGYVCDFGRLGYQTGRIKG